MLASKEVVCENSAFCGNSKQLDDLDDKGPESG